MKTRDYEHISALMDEAIASRKEREAALCDLMDDADTRRVWYEYHLIRDCLQNHQTELGYDVSSGLKERLRAVGSLKWRKRTYLPANHAFKGLAVAAGVAAVAVAVWQIMPTDTSPAGFSAMDDAGGNTPLTLSIGMANESAQPVQSIVPDGMTVALDDPYLQAHQRAMTTDGLMRVSASFEGVQ